MQSNIKLPEKQTLLGLQLVRTTSSLRMLDSAKLLFNFGEGYYFQLFLIFHLGRKAKWKQNIFLFGVNMPKLTETVLHINASDILLHATDLWPCYLSHEQLLLLRLSHTLQIYN